MPKLETKKNEPGAQPNSKSEVSFLDLHWKDAEPDLDIASEGICCKNIDEIIKRIDEVKDTVKKINLDNQPSLTEIPAVIGECKMLRELDVSHTNIKDMPDFIFTLPSLLSLSCRCKDLVVFPKSISKAEKLEHLHLRINSGWKLPDEIISLKNLKTLAIDLYSDAALPEKLGTLARLEELTLAIKYEEGSVPFLPDSFKNHPALKKVTINDPFYKKYKVFDLEHTVKILSSCSKLESLTLSGILVAKGHQSLSKLTGLKALELRHLFVEGNIIDSVKNLHKLQKLDIWGSEFKLTKLPDVFEDFKELRSLSIAGNFVKKLPPSIYKLTKLTTLEIGSSGITALDEKIGSLKELEKLHIYDNLLEKLPESIYSLPRLTVLNIEENIFAQQEISAIRGKLDTKRIEFLYEGQGNRQFVKKLRALKDSEETDLQTYCKLCLAAVNENLRSIKYVNKKKLGSRHYAELCMLAVKKSCYALKDIEPESPATPYYYLICMEAAKKSEKTHILKSVRDELLTDAEYIQICIEAALHNTYVDFLETVNHERLKREAYERVCWVAALRLPSTVSKMINPTEELRKLAEKQEKNYI